MKDKNVLMNDLRNAAFKNISQKDDTVNERIAILMTEAAHLSLSLVMPLNDKSIKALTFLLVSTFNVHNRDKMLKIFSALLEE